MGKKSNCKFGCGSFSSNSNPCNSNTFNKSSYFDTSNRSSSSSSSSSTSCSSTSKMSSVVSSMSSKSNMYGFCCNKYPKCKCHCSKPKCAPIYYPNNFVGPYPCNPYNPCNSGNPCDPCNPCNTTPKLCGSTYTSNNQIITTNLILSQSSPNVNIFYNSGLADSPLIATLPPIVGLGCCCYTKMFVISNLNNLPQDNDVQSVGLVNIITSGTDLFITGGTTFVVNPGCSVVLYSYYVPSGYSYWVVLSNCPIV